MQIRVLGPLEVVSDDGRPVSIGPRKRRIVLGALTLDAGRTVSTDRLVDAVWPDDPPTSALATLRGLIYQLRLLIGPDAIESQPLGYRLSPDGVLVDLRQLEALIERGSIDELAQALEMFRGRPFEDLGDGEPFGTARQWWLERRLYVFETWCDLMLAARRPAEVADRIERELIINPWRESFWERLMLALYRASRQADALQAYTRARHLLAEDLGLEPGTGLQTLEQQILLHDPALEPGARSTAGVGQSRDLPRGTVAFLLTDVVGSTRLWERGSEAMSSALSRHHEILTSAVAGAGGILVQARGESDSTFSAFTDPASALEAAVTAQCRLVNEPWSDEAVLSVRMAVHVGEAFEQDGDYFGPTVNRTARLRAIAAGGQILVSEAAAEACGASLPEKVSLRDLGIRQLREVNGGVRVVLHPDLIVRANESEPVARQRALADASVAFVGRAGELIHLKNRCMDVGGMGSVSMVVGEPGIGKTRLVSEVADALVGEGHVVLWGRCPDGEWASPYAPFVEAFERYLGAIEPDEAVRLLSPVATSLANVLPIVGEAFPAVSADGTVDADTRRFQILDALRHLLEGIAATHAVVLVLDDLHWVDDASATAIAFLMPVSARMRVHIIGTYRDTEVDENHPLSSAMVSAQRVVRVDRVRLRGLSIAAAHELIEGISATVPTDAEVAEIVSGSGGNPFFMSELVRFRAEDSTAAIPDSVNDAIRRRLASLDGNTTTMLRVGALFDERFPLHVARLVADLEEDSALDALDEAIHARLIEPAEDLDEYRFVHALVRVAVESMINPSRRPRLHRRIATMLDEQRGDVGDAHDLARIAFHFHASRGLPGAERGVAPALTAAAHADALAAHSERAGLLRMALELMRDDDRRRPRAQANLAHALVRSRQPDRAVQFALDAADALAIEDGGDAAAVFLAELIEDLGTTGNYPEQVTLLRLAERGLALADDDNSEFYHWLVFSQRWFFSVQLGEDRFRERASIIDDQDFVAFSRETLRSRSRFESNFAVSAGARSRAELLALDRTGRYALSIAARHPKIVEHAAVEIERLRALGHWGDLAAWHDFTARALASMGRLDDARVHRDLARSVNPTPMDAGFVRSWAVTEVILTTVCGGPWNDLLDRITALASAREDTAMLWGRALADEGWPMVQAMAMLPRVHNGEVMRAIAMAQSLTEFLDDASIGEYYYAFVAHSCAEVAWQAASRNLAHAIEPAIRNRWLPCDFRACGANVHLSMARLCGVDGRLTEAATWFAQARDDFREEEARPLLAMVDHDEAWMHLRHPGSAEPEEVAQLLDRGISEFESMGMTGWLEHAATLRQQLAQPL